MRVTYKLFTVKGSLEDEGDLQAQKSEHKVATERKDQNCPH